MLDIKKTGVGYYTASMIESLAALPSDSIELTGYYFDFLSHNGKKPPTSSNIKYHKIKYIPGKLLSLCRRFNFQPPLELFVRKNVDITLFTNYVSLPSMYKHRTALVIYDLSFLDQPQYLQDINLDYLKRFCPPSISRADLIITISEFTKTRILHYFPNLSGRIVVTPIPPASAEEPSALGTRLTTLGIRSKKYILYLGTIEPRKNIQKLVQAYAQLDPTIRQRNALVLAGGKGWKDDAIKSEITTARQNGCNIIETDYVSEAEKAQLYAHSACFVFPSHYEGFGMPILEAMQYQVPVLASDIAVFHEVAGDAAAYFDKDNPVDIARCMTELLNDTGKSNTLVANGTRRLQNFSWVENADKVYAAFTSIL